MGKGGWGLSRSSVNVISWLIEEDLCMPVLGALGPLLPCSPIFQGDTGVQGLPGSPGEDREQVSADALGGLVVQCTKGFGHNQEKFSRKPKQPTGPHPQPHALWGRASCVWLVWG